MFAVTDFGTGRLAQAIVNGLAILGAFLIGYVAAAVAANRLQRTRPPNALNRACRVLTGFALATLAAVILFGHGQGWTLFGGGGESRKNDATGTQPISTPIPPPEPQASPSETDAQLAITILGGTDVVEQRFYLIDGQELPRTISEIKADITESPKKPRTIEVRFSERNVLPHDHPAVTMLVRWLREEAGLAVTMPADKR